MYNSKINISSDEIEKNLPNLDQFAVYGENITINVGSKYKPNFVINKLSISIPKGCIYGLIGPSGCGKTTLQRTIAGLRKPDFGWLKVFNQIPCSKGSSVPGPLVGYMPQEIALDDELTVTEQLTFLGRLGGLNSETIKSQCRQILSIMSIEEVTKADYFGFMAKGQIEFQGQPEACMRSVGATTFEHAILTRYNHREQYKKDASIIKVNQTEQSSSTEPVSLSFSGPTAPLSQIKIGSLQLTLLIMWRYLLRWKGTLLIPYMLLVVSLIFIGYFMPSFFGHPMVDLNLAYVNLANSSVYVSNLTEHLINHDIHLIQVQDEIIGRKMVEDGQASAYFIVPEEFDLGIETRVASALSSTADEALQLAGRITIYQDNSHALISKTIKKKIYEALNDIMDSIVKSKGLIGNRLEFIKIIGVIDRIDDPDLLVSLPLFLIRLLT